MKEARVQYKKAADLGYHVAQYNLAKMLWDGKGGPVDRAEALAQYTRAANQGHPLSQDMLANILQQEETAHIVFEQLLAEETESNGKTKGEKKKKKEKKKTEQATAREESIAPSIGSLFEEQCSIGGGDALAPSIEPIAAVVCSLEDAGDVTGRELAVVESTMGGGGTCIVCFKGDNGAVRPPDFVRAMLKSTGRVSYAWAEYHGAAVRLKVPRHWVAVDAWNQEEGCVSRLKSAQLPAHTAHLIFIKGVHG